MTEKNETNMSMRDGFSKAWDKVRAEKQTLFLMGLLYALVLTIVSWGTISGELAVIKTMDGGDFSAPADPAVPDPFQIFSYVAAIIAGSFYYVAITRLYIGGREAVLEGGFQALSRRALMVLWRQICAIFILAMAIAPFAVLATGLLASLGKSPLSGVVIALILVGLTLAVMLFISVMMVAVVDASMDVRTTLRQAYSLLKGKRLRLGSTYLMTGLIMAIITLIVSFFVGAVGGAISPTLSIIGFMLCMYVMGTFMTYVLIGGVAETMAVIRGQKHVDTEA